MVYPGQYYAHEDYLAKGLLVLARMIAQAMINKMQYTDELSEKESSSSINNVAKGGDKSAEFEYSH
jgi:hypothetical protein